ncbi:MAG: RHS repeat-associated core domain-containing protein [Fimbriimonadaceae bacterium]|nr:RHS repeat-associated core domain-containing protein [Fimbriimonadaceae bacterium]
MTVRTECQTVIPDGPGIDFLAESIDGGAETVGFPLYDGHGNMIATLGRAESSPYFGVADLRTYDVWGSVRSGSTTGDPRQRYCANLGHVQDDESGLIYMRARYYEPWTGRFVSEDPAMSESNWYSYCLGDPVNAVDKSGQSRYYDWDVQFSLGSMYFGFALILVMSRWGGTVVSKAEKYAVSALLVASAFHLSNAVGGTSLSDDAFLNFVNHSIAYVGMIAMIAEGLEKSRFVHIAGKVAIYACALYSLVAIGLLIQLDE